MARFGSAAKLADRLFKGKVIGSSAGGLRVGSPLSPARLEESRAMVRQTLESAGTGQAGRAVAGQSPAARSAAKGGWEITQEWGVQTPGRQAGIRPESPLAGVGVGGPAQNFRTRVGAHLDEFDMRNPLGSQLERTVPGGIPQGAGSPHALIGGDFAAARPSPVPEAGARFLGGDFDKKTAGFRREFGQIGDLDDAALAALKKDLGRHYRVDNMRDMGLDTTAFEQRIAGARTADDFRGIVEEAARPGSGVRDAYMQTYGTGRHRISDPMYAHRVPQKAAAVGGTAWLVSSLSNRRGRMSNAELYGQGGGY